MTWRCIGNCPGEQFVDIYIMWIERPDQLAGSKSAPRRITELTG
jgi:hypothetical protein